MNARELYQAGQLTEAVQALGAEIRENPTDTKRRTFLFELLSFAGDYDRALKQLDILAQQGPAPEPWQSGYLNHAVFSWNQAAWSGCRRGDCG